VFTRFKYLIIDVDGSGLGREGILTLFPYLYLPKEGVVEEDKA